MSGDSREEGQVRDALRYRKLLRFFFPRRVVERDGPEMERTFLWLLGVARKRRGRRGTVWVWVRAVGDGVWNGWVVRLRDWEEIVNNVWTDLRHAIRSFRRRPSFTAVIVLSLALGIGGSTAIFSVFNSVLLRDLPYPDPGQIYLMRTVAPDGGPGGITPPEARYFTENPDHPIVEAFAYGWSQDTQIADADGVTYGTRRYGVTEQFFDVFPTRMALGSGFHDAPPGTIVIAYSVWRDLFGSDPDIIGKSIQVEGNSRQVVGVTGESFVFSEDPGYWYHMQLSPAYDRVRYRAFVRLRPGRTEEQFRAELERFPTEIGPDPATGRPMTYTALPYLDYVVGDLRSTVTILLGATGLLLLIACINVTNLMLSRATAHSREAALRQALGAGRWPILRRLVTESLLLAFAGGALGLIAGAAGVRLLLGLGPALPRLDSVPMDRTVLMFALGVTVVTGAIIGLAPAWRLAKSEIRSLVSETGGGAGGGRRTNRLFGSLVVAEVALAVMLVIGAGLLVQTYSNLTHTDAGFRPERALTFYLNVPGLAEMTFERMDAQGQPVWGGAFYAPVADFYRELEARIEGLAGVEAASTATTIPLAPLQYDQSQMLINLPDQPGGMEPIADANTHSVGYDFFETMGTRLLEGRGLQATDRQGTPGVAVVNETFARRLLADGDPIGQHIHFPANGFKPGQPGFQFGHYTVDDVEVVGVVEDVKYLALAEPTEPKMFIPAEQWISRRRYVVVRAGVDDPASLIPAIDREIKAMDSSLTARFDLYPSLVAASVARERLGMTLLVVFGLTALVLAAVGIYGLMSQYVSQRTGEIAVRTAMGATGGRVMRLVMRRGIAYSLAGVVLGVAGAAGFRRVLESQLYGVSALDPRVFVAVPVGLLAIAALACFLPSRRATRIAPADLLRAE